MKKYKNSDEYANEMEKKSKAILKVSGLGTLVVAIFLSLGFGFKLLWNRLMPGIFNLKKITFWEGIGLLTLAKLIFGGISDINAKKDSPTSHDVKAVVSEGLHKEMQEAFKKDYIKKYGDDDVEEATNKSTVVHSDELYERWWKEDGEKYFDQYLEEQLK